MVISQKKTKIVATIGPASRSPEIVRRLLLEGVNVFRLNFSHGNHEDHGDTIQVIRKEAETLKMNPAIMADLQGPKIRTGETIDKKSYTVPMGASVVVTTKDVPSDASIISIDYPHLIREVNDGQNILINDGAIRLEVERVDVENNTLDCRVLDEGSYSSHKGVNLPNVDLSIPSLTEKDISDLEFVLSQDVQYIALSFVRKADDLSVLRKMVNAKRNDIKLIAKIEKPEAAERIDEILSECEGIMVARGDLGVEVSPFSVPVLQKDLITKANKNGKLVIVATQMLESMIKNSLPTRAESSDVANAILDGTDAIMLSGETAIGSYPVESVKTMTKIALIIEKSDYYPTNIIDLNTQDLYAPHALSEASAWATRDLGGIPICVFTVSGDTAIYLSKIRNQSPIFSFSPTAQVTNSLSMVWNLRSFLIPFDGDFVELQNRAEQILLEYEYVLEGDTIAVLSGTTPARGATNFLRIKRIGEEM